MNGPQRGAMCVLGAFAGPGADKSTGQVRLSALIDLLNDRFGTELTEADKIWFDQQVQAAAPLGTADFGKY